MEFYRVWLSAYWFAKTSFNSQRDGILRNPARRAEASRPFQFPTGWNSTYAIATSKDERQTFQFPTGWNSTFSRLIFELAVEVSIPNGMEFYRKPRSKRYREPKRFNSQRDGILLCDTKPKEKTKESFNSQRDGILLYHCAAPNPLFVVSIPNGMEFYSILSRGLKCPWGSFNSQRDGILPQNCGDGRLRTLVSIPNGMEFYHCNARVTQSNKNGFNSQRDGILLETALTFCRRVACFNSQRDGILHEFLSRRSQKLIVSIPNGMEFYKNLVSFTTFFRHGFNSQRDGILRYRISLQIEYSPFQFPTGWNSTLLSGFSNSSLNCFNSQRDGILRKFIQ